MASGNACMGKPAPNFKATSMVDGAFKEVKLSDYKGKYVVLFFYPLDSQFTHLAWINIPRKEGGLGPLNIPLLANVARRLSEDYGELKRDECIAYWGLFIIDGKGVLRQITVNDLPVGHSLDEALQLVQTIQYTDEHREVCPAGWKLGSNTIKLNVDDGEEYFSKQN
uniref:Peroxiredoxin-2 n=1 Tax=Pan troglodytes TaxID=9598 RepID=A0A2I3RPW0_PANTR